MTDKKFRDLERALFKVHKKMQSLEKEYMKETGHRYVKTGKIKPPWKKA